MTTHKSTPIDSKLGMGKISTWAVSWEPPITLFDVEKIKAKATKLEKLRLKLRPKQYSLDGDYMIAYKEMDNKLFVLTRKIRKAK